MPDWMHTSVAPSCCASAALRPTSSNDSVYASGSVARWANAQNRQPT